MRGKLPFLITAAAATLAATVLPAAGATAAPTVSTAPAVTAAAREPACNADSSVLAGNGWRADVPAVLTRTGARYQSCYLAYGDRSVWVRLLQERLRDCYGFDLQGTGYFGEQTRAAVRQVQRSHGITADGVYGPQTFKAMRWRLYDVRYQESQLCHRPFVNRSVATAPSPGSYSPYCSHPEARYASNGWWAILPGLRTRTSQPSFACYLKQGDRGEGVYRLQMQLRDCYKAGLAIDGYYGTQTKATVQRVQKLHGVTVDGVYGPATMKAMYWRLNRYNPFTFSERCHSPF
jgi:peptidoglycan hydrolase-like protein with peptidoglycan-binding domain